MWSSPSAIQSHVVRKPIAVDREKIRRGVPRMEVLGDQRESGNAGVGTYAVDLLSAGERL